MPKFLARCHYNEEEINRHLKTKIWYWAVQINGNKFATSQILKKPVVVVKGWILAGWAQKSPELCFSSLLFSLIALAKPLKGGNWGTLDHFHSSRTHSHSGPLHTWDWGPMTIATSSTLIGGKGGAGPSSPLHTTIEGPIGGSMWMHARRWM